jgi:hypothetical protein
MRLNRGVQALVAYGTMFAVAAALGYGASKAWVEAALS